MNQQPVVTPDAGVPEVDQEPVHDHIFGVRCRPDCPRWGNPVPQPGWEQPQDWFFTFGWDHHHPISGQPLRKSFVRIHGTCDSTREEMLAAFGNRWSFQYSPAEKPLKIDRYDLVEVPMPGQEPAVEQDDEALREVYAQDEADQDRVPTEAGFDVWKSLRRAVGQAEPPVTPAEARTGVSDVQAAVLDTVQQLRTAIAKLDPLEEGYASERYGHLYTHLDRIESWVGGGRR
jgi:hypothetical protein